MSEILTNIYNQLTEDNLIEAPQSEWENSFMQDPEARANIFNYLQENKFVNEQTNISTWLDSVDKSIKDTPTEEIRQDIFDDPLKSIFPNWYKGLLTGLEMGTHKLLNTETGKVLEKEEEKTNTDREKPSFIVTKKILGDFLGKNAVTDYISETLSELYESTQSGIKQGSVVQPAYELMENQETATEETIENFYKAGLELEQAGSTDAVKSYQKTYEQNKEKYGGITAFMLGVGENPEYIRDVSVQSLASMATSFFASSEARERILPTSVGAGVVGAATTAGPGAVPSFLYTLFGSTSGVMDAGLSYGEFMKEQIEADGKKYNADSIKEFLENDEVITYKDPRSSFLDITGTRRQIVKNRALRRGFAIGTIDTLTAGISAGVGSKLVTKGGKLITPASRNVRVGAAAVTGGLASEIGGQFAGSQEFEAGEILTEGFAEKGLVLTGATLVPKMLKNKNAKYFIGKKQFKNETDFINEINQIDDYTLARSQVKIENNDELLSALNERINDSYYKATLDPKYSNEQREELLVLNKEYRKLQNKKKSLQTSGNVVPKSLSERIKEIEDEVNEIDQGTKKADRRTKETKQKEQLAKEARQVMAKYKLADSEKFVEVVSEQLGYDPYQAFDNNEDFVKMFVGRMVSKFVNKNPNATQKQIDAEAQRLANEADMSDGLKAVDGVIMINREAASKYNQLKVGEHEVLHAVIDNTWNLLSTEEKTKVISEFKDVLKDEFEGVTIKSGTYKGKSVFDAISERLTINYSDVKGFDINTSVEWLNALSDIMEDDSSGITYENSKTFFDTVSKILQNFYRTKTDFKNLTIATGRDAFEFLKEYSKSIKAGKLSEAMVAFEKAGKTAVSDKDETSSPSKSESVEKLIRIKNNKKKTSAERANAEKQIKKQFDNLALKALGFDPKVKIAQRDEVLAEARKFYTSILQRFNPRTSKFSTWVFNNINPKKAQIYEAAKIKEKPDSKSLSAPDAMEIEGDVNVSTNTAVDEFIKKINVLGFNGVQDVVNKIKNTVKVKPGDNFKQVIKNHVDKVGELIFKVPPIKINDGTKNLTYAKKFIDGIPEQSEAGNIQKFFNAGTNAERFIKILPPTNVTSETADINKIPENIDVSRDTLGLAIGLKGLPLNYFYNKTNKRSKGLSSQPPIWELKSEFKNPTPETVDQFKKDLGITPKKELNNYNRDIGQLLKGVAKVYSINASLSAAQRNLEVKLKTAPVEQKQAIKQQTADITAAQSPDAFSRSQTIIDKYRNFALDTKGISELLEVNGMTIDNLTTKTGVDNYIKGLKKHVFILAPYEFFFGERGGSVFVPSSRIAFPDKKSIKESLNGVKNKKGEWIKKPEKDPKKRAILEKRMEKGLAQAKYYKTEINKAKKDSKFGKKIDVKDFQRQSYKDAFGNSSKEFDKKNKDGSIKAWNEKHGKIHKIVWQRIFSQIKKDKNAAIPIGNFLRLVSQDTKHFHRLGAEFVAWSKNPLGNGKKMYEFEHAMPATASYLYLMDTAINKRSFKPHYDAVMENYKLIALDAAMDKKLKSAGLTRKMPKGWKLIDDFWWQRYFNSDVVKFDGGIDPKSIVFTDGKTFESKFSINAEGNTKGTVTNIDVANSLSKSIQNQTQTQKYHKNKRGMSTFDFDETLIVGGKNFVTAKKGDDVIKISSEQWPLKGPELQEQGYTFDFKDFVNVRGGTEGPLLQKMKNQIKKFGPSNVFVLTARMQESDTAIHGWLKSQGINIPLKNITGLGNSTGEAKAIWMANKFSEGYNDMYFVDDALPNVKAVKHILSQLDVKSKVQQTRFSKSNNLDTDFNKILEDVKGIKAEKRFSATKAKRRGKSKGRFRLFIPPSHEDLLGLIYNFLGKGKKGDKHRDFFEENILKPLNKAYREYNAATQVITTDYKNLLKNFPEIRKKLTKKTPDGDFYYSDAVRVYLWNKFGFEIPNVSKADVKELVDLVKSDQDLMMFADTIGLISRVDEGYIAPTETWEAGDIKTDLADATNKVGRKKYFAEFIENAGVVFSKENLNKIEAIYGTNFREALEDVLYRTINGTNRQAGNNKMVNRWLDYINGSVGATMFVNIRSAVLQQLSFVNFLNFADNNIFASSRAFADQKQFWKDYMMIFNSDMLKQRRRGAAFDISTAELSQTVSKSSQPARALIRMLLQKGFLPTQIADSNAIALGGAAFYRNRVNTYVKQGFNQKKAEAKAFEDFQAVAEATQQSARPDMLSQQQASPLGRLILAFQNVTSQYARITKKAGLDLINRRKSPPYKTQSQSDMANLSKILYYGAAQNIIFYGLQTGLFAIMFGEDEEDEKLVTRKRGRILQGTLDSLLRGIGVTGAVISTLKNTAMKYTENKEKSDFIRSRDPAWQQLLALSPPIDIKFRKLKYAERDIVQKGDVIEHMGTFDINNPVWSATTNIIEGTTNIPLNRAYEKTMNIREAMDSENKWWQRTFMWAGWSRWNFGIENEAIEDAEKQIKARKKFFGGKQYKTFKYKR